MARTLLFDFKSTTRSALSGFRRVRRGMQLVRTGIAQTRKAWADMRRGQHHVVTGLGGMVKGLATTGAGIMSFVSGPLGLLKNGLVGIISLGGQVLDFLKKWTMIAGGVTLGLSVKGLSQFGNFERTMYKVSAVMDTTEEDFKKVDAVVEKVIRESEFMPGAIAQAALELAKLGVSSGEGIETLLPQVRALASAMGVDIPTAAEMLKQTMNMFGMETSDASGVIETFFNAFTRSAADATRLSNALKYIGPIAAVDNQSLKDTVALIETLVDRGLEASQAGTALRNVFLTLMKPTGEAAKVIKEELGLGLEEVSLVGNSFLDVLKKLVDAEMSAEQATRMFNIRGIGAARILTQVFHTAKGSAKGVMEYRRELDETGRVTGYLSGLNLQLAQRWDILKGSVDGAFISWGRFLDKEFDIANRVARWSDAVNEFSDSLANMPQGALTGLFAGMWSDLESGRFLQSMKHAFLGIWELLKPLLHWLASNASATFLNALADGLLYGITEFGLVGIWAKVFGVDMEKVRDQLRGWRDDLGLGIQGVGFDEAFEGARDRAMEQFGEAGRWLYGTRAAIGRAERMQQAAALTEQMRGPRGLIVPSGSVEDPLYPSPPPTFIDNKKIINYGTSQRAMKQSKGSKLQGDGGSR